MFYTNFLFYFMNLLFSDQILIFLYVQIIEIHVH